MGTMPVDGKVFTISKCHSLVQYFEANDWAPRSLWSYSLSVCDNFKPSTSTGIDSPMRSYWRLPECIWPKKEDLRAFEPSQKWNSIKNKNMQNDIRNSTAQEKNVVQNLKIVRRMADKENSTIFASIVQAPSCEARLYSVHVEFGVSQSCFDRSKDHQTHHSLYTFLVTCDEKFIKPVCRWFNWRSDFVFVCVFADCQKFSSVQFLVFWTPPVWYPGFSVQ